MLNTKQLVDLIDSASRLRTRLVWLVGMPGSGKTNELKAIAAGQPDCVYVNLNATLSSRLAGDSPDQQPFKVGQHLGSILSPRLMGSWLIDNVEILFSQKLKIRVVDQLNSLAQQATLVAAWPGSIENGRLTYGARNHPDFAEYPIDSPLVLDLNNTNSQGK
jgi:hypothetical protein